MRKRSFERTVTPCYLMYRGIIIGRVTKCSVYDSEKLGYRYFANIATNARETELIASFGFISQQIQEINNQVAQFRDLLINIGQPRDCPELREKIRRLRRHCVEACKNTSQLILPQVRRYGKSFHDLSFFSLVSFPERVIIKEIFNGKSKRIYVLDTIFRIVRNSHGKITVSTSR